MRGKGTTGRGLLAALWLAGLGLVQACGPQIPVQAPQSFDLATEAIAGRDDAPPSQPEGACWGRDVLPAVIETETTTRLVTPEKRDAQGQMIPATYRSDSRQRMVRDRQTVWIRTPCYDQITPDSVLTLQRALRARGVYLGPLDGALTPETMTAIRRYQADLGLDTQVLSLRAAQTLGLVLTPVAGAS